MQPLFLTMTLPVDTNGAHTPHLYRDEQTKRLSFIEE